MAGGNGQRRKDDFYATPWEATVAIYKEIGNHLPETIIEPACGDGAIGKLLELYGHQVIATDLVDRGYGMGGVNFLSSTQIVVPEALIWTNPPFKHATAFIENALLVTSMVVMLVKAQFWHAANRYELFHRTKPAVFPLTWRLDFTGGGNPTMDCSWCVWGLPVGQGHPLAKPDPLDHPVFS